MKTPLPVRLLLARGVFFLLTGVSAPAAVERIAVVWDRPTAGEISVDRGSLAGPGAAPVPSLAFAAPRDCRIDFTVEGSTAAGDLATLVTVRAAGGRFTFRLKDVDRDYPIYLPAFHAAVTTGEDPRTYAAIAAAIRSRGLHTKLEDIQSAPEETFAHAAATTRSMKIQTWLGLSRDVRIFRVDERLQSVSPRFHWVESRPPELGNKPAVYEFLFGRGWGLRDDISRRLEDGVLPILCGRIGDEDIAYQVTMFAGLERSALTAASLRGTPYLVADSDAAGHMFTAEQKAALEAVRRAEPAPAEETVLYLRSVATNRGAVPRFALFKTATPQNAAPTAWSYDGARGFSVFKSGRVFAVTRLNGQASASEESAVLLKPGERAVFEMYLPHEPISAERARALAAQSFDRRHAETRAFWEAKLDSCAKWHLPEPRIDEMARAGLLHLDLITYGREPGGTLIPTIGDYTAIGSESAPIIQFMDSMGWHDMARRALDFFLEKQHPDGFMQNFNGYMLETGAVLWSLGEHYRYTRDRAWLRQIEPKILKACAYLQAWRARSRNGIPSDGYGMLEGKTADPDDPYRSFMLNGYAYLGLSRVAEMLEDIDPAEAKTWREEAESLRADIRASLQSNLERSPVVPLGDGSWSPAAAPWTGYRGPVMLHADGGSWFTHGSMAARDSLLGPLYLVFQEVLDPAEPMAEMLLATHSELMTWDNVAFSQPYYSRHPYLHLRRGEVKPFIKSWYDAMAALADRETYTFSEHFFGASPHKTHEEAWFLMQTRWMLYLEQGRTLRLLAGVPRAYLEDGKTIEVSHAASYFGPLSFKVESLVKSNLIRASVTCPGERRPDTVEIRIPHPGGRRPVSVEGGVYLPEQETVRIEHFTGSAEIRLTYGPP